MIIFDDLLKWTLVSRTEVQKEIEELMARAEVKKTSPNIEVWDHLNIIDMKGAALLTHISLFTAIASLLLEFSEGEDMEMVFAVELAVYLVLAFLCLRCFRVGMSKVSRRKNGELEAIVKEMIYRRKLYIFCLEATGAATVGLIVATVFKVL